MYRALTKQRGTLRHTSNTSEPVFMVIFRILNNYGCTLFSLGIFGDEYMINELLYMETRVFREFCNRYHLPSEKVNNIFNSHNIWNYIESCYELLHVNGDDYILKDIECLLKKQGVVL